MAGFIIVFTKVSPNLKKIINWMALWLSLHKIEKRDSELFWGIIWWIADFTRKQLQKYVNSMIFV